MLDVSMGKERVRVWPKKRGKAKTAEAKRLQDRFRQANWAAKYWDPRNIMSVDEMRKGTPVLIRDLQVMMMYGRFANFSMSDGRMIYTMQARQDVSDSLDSISPIVGTMLLRTVDGWRYIAPPTTDGEYLTASSDLVPQWQAPPITPGYTPYDINTPSASSFSKASGDATQLILTDNGNIGLGVDCGATAAGQISRIAYKTLTNKALAWQLTVKIPNIIASGSTTGIGVYMMDSISTRAVSFDLKRESSNTGVFYWTGLNTFNATPFGITFQEQVQWVQITSNGSTLTYAISTDGIFWTPLFAEPILNWMPNKPDRIGFGSNTNRTNTPKNIMTVNYFTLTGPAV